MTRRSTTFSQDFRTFFVRGLIILLPTIITLALFAWAGRFLWTNVAEPINAAVRAGVVAATPHVLGPRSRPDWYNVTETRSQEVRDARIRQGQLKASADQAVVEQQKRRIVAEIRQQNLANLWRQRFYLQPIGLIVAVILIYLVGLAVGNYLGRRIFTLVEGWAMRVPVVKQVYPSVKQIVEFLTGSGTAGKSMLSGRVVAFEYPRKGVWTLGLMTGETIESIQTAAGVDCVTIFVPSSPTPFTGYTVTVARSDVVDLPMTLDEALRFVVSGGVVVPAWKNPRPWHAPNHSPSHLALSSEGGKIDPDSGMSPGPSRPVA